MPSTSWASASRNAVDKGKSSEDKPAEELEAAEEAADASV